MSERADSDSLRDIREAVCRMRSYTEGMTYDHFREDFKTQDAVIRNLEIIGEATKNLSPGIREKYPDIPWKEMTRVRDRLIHHYFGINLDIVWNIVTVELPVLESQLEAILQKENSGG